MNVNALLRLVATICFVLAVFVEPKLSIGSPK